LKWQAINLVKISKTPTFAAPNLLLADFPTSVGIHWDKPIFNQKNSSNEQLRIDGDFHTGIV
jgi:hypothetical protein